MNATRLAFLVLASLLLAAPLPAAVATIDVSPLLPTSADPMRITVIGYFSGCVLGIAPQVDGATVRITAVYSGIITCPLAGDRIFIADLPPLAAGAYRFLLEDRFVARATRTLIVAPESTTLDLHEGRFSAHLRFHTGPEADAQEAPAVSLTRESGYFWFYAPLNPEVTLKVLDGRGVNGHFWVFASSLTDRSFTLVVRDETLACLAPPCANERTYTSTAGVVANFIDLAAF